MITGDWDTRKLHEFLSETQPDPQRRFSFVVSSPKQGAPDDLWFHRVRRREGSVLSSLLTAGDPSGHRLQGKFHMAEQKYAVLCPHPDCQKVVTFGDNVPAGEYDCLCKAARFTVSWVTYLSEGRKPALTLVEKKL